MGIMGEYEQAFPDCISGPAAWTVVQPGEYQNWKYRKAVEWWGWWRIPKWPYLNRGQDGKLLTNNQSSCSPINSGPKQRAPWAPQRPPVGCTLDLPELECLSGYAEGKCTSGLTPQGKSLSTYKHWWGSRVSNSLYRAFWKHAWLDLKTSQDSAESRWWTLPFSNL